MKSLSFIAGLFLTACVTINIYFPAAAAEKVADQIIQEIQQEGDRPETKQSPETSPQSRSAPENWHNKALVWVGYGLDFLIEPVHAAANLDINSPDIRRIKARMQQRFSSLKQAYDQGWIGIKNDGYLITRAGVPLSQRNRVNKLVAAENSDRQQLYQAIANANGHPEWTSQIQQTFAKRWISHAHSGWWYQRSNGQWVQK